MDVFQFGCAKSFCLPPSRSATWPRNQLQRAGGPGEFQNNFVVRIAREFFALRGDLKRLRQQGVARQHGDAFAEDLVVGGLAAAEIVVVHRGQIVVDERIGVDALDGAGQRQGVVFRAAAGLGGGQAKRRTHSFAAGKNRIAHGFVDGGGFGRFRRQEFIQRAVDGFRARGQELLQFKLFLWADMRRSF